MRPVTKKRSTVHCWNQRELYGKDNFKQYKDWRSLIDRIGVEKVLEGHQGCVNTLKWNRAGTLLVSGSDDQTVKIWNMSGRPIHSINTGHTGNVFSADFIPQSNDRMIVSCAADANIRLHYLDYKEDPFIWEAKGRVKRLAIANDEPHLFWSAAEDGEIREHDIRTYKASTILNSDDQFKSLAICSERSEYLAIAPTSQLVPVYDRRYMSSPLIEVLPGDAFDPLDGNYPTHVGFDDLGNELLVNMGGRGVYIFDIKNPEVAIDNTWIATENILKTSGCEQKKMEGNEGLKMLVEQIQELLERSKKDEAVDLCHAEIASGQYMDNDLSCLLTERSNALRLRERNGDNFAALKDAVKALELCSGNSRALFSLARALVALKQFKLATRACKLYRTCFPNCNAIRRVEKNITSQEDEFDGTLRSYRDYKERYVGHLNIRTDIKEAAFFGGEQGFILAGSDSGNLVIWDRTNGTLKSVYDADQDILNIVQPHPTLPLIATSGIEDLIRIWAPISEENVAAEKCTDSYRALANVPDSISLAEATFLRPEHLMRLAQMSEMGQIDCITQ